VGVARLRSRRRTQSLYTGCRAIQRSKQVVRTFSEIRIVSKRYDSVGRLVAQKGVFTWLHSESYLDLVVYLGVHSSLEHLARFILKGHAIVDAVADLDAHGIDWRLVYPDVHGAALATNALLYKAY